MTADNSQKNASGKYLLQFLSVLPYSLLRACARTLSMPASHPKSRLRKVVDVNLSIAFPDKSQREKEAIAKQTIKEFLTTAFELPKVWMKANHNSKQLYRSFEGKELIENALKEGNGLILITPHLGHWEFMLLVLAHNFPCTLLCNNVDDIIDIGLSDTVRTGRMKTGARLVETDQGIRPLMKALKAGEIVIIAPDQIPPGSKGTLFVDFFGKEVATMSLMPRLAKASGAALLSGYTERQENGQCIVKIRSVDDDMLSDDVNKIALGMNKTIENLIRECPTQYLWTYKRFRLGPEGKRKIYK